MPRPCAADHPSPRDTAGTRAAGKCPTCWLYLHSPFHRSLWDGRGRPASQPTTPLPVLRSDCRHLGPVLEWCHTCAGERGHVRECDVHEKCTLGDSKKTVACCLTCPDYEPDPPGTLAVVTCHFNPAGYRRPVENYHRFAAGIRAAGVPLYTAEVAFDDRPFIVPDAAIQVRGGPEHILWQKERLLNLLIERLPSEVEYVAWVDADVLFADPGWPARTVAALRDHPVVQPWQVAYLTGPGGAVGSVHRACTTRGGSHPGYAWAARRDVFPIYDRNVVGSGDVMLTRAWGLTPGMQEKIDRMSPAWRAHWSRWAETQTGIAGRVGSVRGSLTHLYHGSGANRRYFDRLDLVSRAGYDPDRDVEVDPATGLLRWTPGAEQLRRAVAEYFAGRREDD